MNNCHKTNAAFHKVRFLGLYVLLFSEIIYVCTPIWRIYLFLQMMLLHIKVVNVVKVSNNKIKMQLHLLTGGVKIIESNLVLSKQR